MQRILFFLTFTLIAAATFAQQHVLKGTVIDYSTKAPLVGATVVNTTQNTGTVTNNEGQFSISLRNTDKIRFSMIGYLHFDTTFTKDAQSIEVKLFPSAYETGTVVITGTGTPHLYEQVPVKTELISSKQINNSGSVNLAEALSSKTGVMVQNECNNCNFKQVRLLGFEGKYTQILIDGDPVVSSLASVYGLDHYPKEMIEQIEIVKGGGSALYGGGAVAGTINIITRQAVNNTGKAEITQQFIGKSLDRQMGLITEFGKLAEGWGIYAYGSSRNRDGYDRNSDGFTELGRLDNLTLGTNIQYSTLDFGSLSLSMHRIYEDRRGGSELEKPNHEALISEWTKHINWGGKLRYSKQLSSIFSIKLQVAFSLLKRNSYYGGLVEDTPENRELAKTFYGNSDNPLITTTTGILANLGAHRFSVGFQYDNDQLIDKSVASSDYFVDEHYITYGAYVQDEWDVLGTNEFVTAAGVRLDNHSTLENPVLSPRFSFRYTPFQSLILRASVSAGYKAPQVFDEDLHICGLEGTQRIVRNSAGLKEESSTSYSMSAEFLDFIYNVPVMFGISGFYTKLDGAYTTKYLSALGKFEFWERINSAGAQSYGIEVNTGIKPLRGAEFNAGFTVKSNKYEEELEDFPTKEFLRTPNFFGFASLQYDLNEMFSVYTTGKYTGSMYIPHATPVPGVDDPLLELKHSSEFFELDAFVTTKIGIATKSQLELTVGVRNIFDSFQNDLDLGVTRDPAYVYGPSQPRTIFTRINFAL